MLEIVRKRSCPAVSQICSLIVFLSSSIVRIFCSQKGRGRGGVGGSAAAKFGGRVWAAGPAAHKVDADGRDVAVGPLVVGEAQQQARLADARVPDQHEDEQVVIWEGRGEGQKGTAAARAGGSRRWSSGG